MYRRHDGFGKALVARGGGLGRRQAPEIPEAVAEAGRGHVPHGQSRRGEVA